MAEGDALKAMISFFTIWMQEITQEDMDAMEKKFHLVPIVGALIGLVVLLETIVLLWLQLNVGFGSTLFTAVVVLATVYVGSRFLHFDGLADFGDGSIVAGTQEDHVRALKDTLVGAGGVGVALIATLLNVSIYAMLSVYVVIIALPMIEILVKNSQVAAAAFGQPGKGMAGRQVSETTMKSMEISSVLTIGLTFVMGLLGAVFTNVVMPWYEIDIILVLVLALVGTLVSIIVGYLMARRSNRVFGMVNGDILGATNEISRIAVGAAIALVFGLWVM